MTNGRLSKDVLGAGKKNNLVQLIWDEYGVETTKNFLDNTQRLVNNFNMYNGFTVGIGDINISKQVETDIHTLFTTVDLDVENRITNIENNPDIMEPDVFEFKLFSDLNVIRDDVSKMVMDNMSPENNFNIMSLSGSKGSATNIGQMGGCVGLQVAQQSRQGF